MAERLQVLVSDNRCVYTFFNFSRNSFSNPITKQFSSVGQFKQLLQEIKQVNVNISEAIFGFESSKFTLAPYGIIEEEERSNVFYFTNKDKPGDFVYADFIAGINGENIYSFPTPLMEVINADFPNRKVIHNTSAIIETTLRTNVKSKDCSVNVFFKEEEFELSICNKGKLLLHNNFVATHGEDFLYYILFALDQLDLPRTSARLFTSGNLENQNKVMTILKKYFTNVNHIEPFNDSITTLNYKQYFSLYNQYLCVS